MIDHEEKILDALEDIPGLTYAGDSWPDGEADYPRIIVALASDMVRDRRDDKPYLVSLEYYLRIFGSDKPTMRFILAECDTRMAAIGYERTFRHEQNDADVKLWTTRYKTTVSATADD